MIFIRIYYIKFYFKFYFIFIYFFIVNDYIFYLYTEFFNDKELFECCNDRFLNSLVVG